MQYEVRKLKFRRYSDMDAYKADVLGILLEDEVLNNLPISILLDSKMDKPANWLLSTVTDDNGTIVLIAMCTKPFNLLLYEPVRSSNNDAVGLLASELRSIGFAPPGVIALTGLARRFADAYCGVRENTGSKLVMSMILMRLDKLTDYNKAPGFSRMLTVEDLSFAPSWEHAFCVDCGFSTSTIPEYEERIRTRVGKDTHFIWEDGQPVAQAVNGRNTPNGAVVNWVYTPPLFRGRGYATSVVAEASRALFDRGKSYCCLFADAANPVSCGIYRKLGYYDVCEFAEIQFYTRRRLT